MEDIHDSFRGGHGPEDIGVEAGQTREVAGEQKRVEDKPREVTGRQGLVQDQGTPVAEDGQDGDENNDDLHRYHRSDTDK